MSKLRLNREKMWETFPVLAPIVEVVSAIISLPFIFAGILIGAAWDGLHSGFIIGRDS